MSEPITRAPCPPGELIREEILAEPGLPIARAAEVLGVCRAILSDLVNGKAALSPEMALRIEKAPSASRSTPSCGCRPGTTATDAPAPAEIDVKRYEPA